MLSAMATEYTSLKPQNEKSQGYKMSMGVNCVAENLWWLKFSFRSKKCLRMKLWGCFFPGLESFEHA